MIPPSRLSLLLLSLFACCASAEVSIDAYGRLPSIEFAALSPNGSMIAYVQTTHDVHALVIVDIGTSALVAGTRIDQEKVRSVEWADDTHVLLTTASTTMPLELRGEKTEWNLMSMYDLGTKKWTSLLDKVRGGGETTMNVVYGRPVIEHRDHETLLYVHGIYVRDVTEPAMFRINVTTGAERLIKEGGDATVEWVVDDAGDVVAEQDYVEQDHRWSIRLIGANGRPARAVSGIAAIDGPEILGLDAAGENIIVALTDSEHVTWKPLSIQDGTWGPDIAPGEVLTDLILDQGSERMLGTAFVGDTTRYHFADPKLQEGWDWIVRVFAYQRLEYMSASADHSKVLVRVLGPKSGYAYYLADLKEHLTQLVGNVYEGIGPIAEVRPIQYPAADGLQIPAYLTLPPNRPAKGLPIVVLPHGGPEARDILDFDWWAQALASQGYAVLQPNYRGSSLDRKWVEAGYGEWGRKMQSDLSDGLRYLAAQGIADPKRACIVGASYGGYAALAGISIQSGIYRCAVAVAGVSDPTSFMRWVMRKEDRGDKQGLRYWERFFGVDDPADKRLDAISPLKQVDRITAPLLLIHGRDDTTVPYDQSADIAKAMERKGKLVQLVTLQKEDHYLSRSATRMQMLESSVEFLKKYNPPD